MSKEAVRNNKIELAKIHIKSKIFLQNSIITEINFLSKVIYFQRNIIFQVLKKNPELEVNKDYMAILKNIYEIYKEYTTFNNDIKTKLSSIEYEYVDDKYIAFYNEIKSKMSSIDGGYYRKYMKYKAKYLQLKSKL